MMQDDLIFEDDFSGAVRASEQADYPDGRGLGRCIRRLGLRCRLLAPAGKPTVSFIFSGISQMLLKRDTLRG